MQLCGFNHLLKILPVPGGRMRRMSFIEKDKKKGGSGSGSGSAREVLDLFRSHNWILDNGLD